MGRLIVLMVLALAGSAFAVVSGKTVEYDGRGAGKVVFDGTVHANAGLKCDDCHPSIFQMKKGETEIRMELISKRKACGACHDGTRAFKAEERTNCRNCHGAAK